jgi:glycosyltransferase involved in cell wall biosynthesis
VEDRTWDGIVCVSHFVKNHFLEKTRIPREKYCVIHNGVDPALFKFQYRFIKRNPHRIVFASHPVKGLDRVIRIVDSLRKTVSDRFHLDVFGGYKLWGQDQPELKLTDALVTFHGLLPQRELIRRLFACSFMINLYDIPEGFGLIYPQAMKAGIICIVSNVGGVSEVIRDGLNGFLVHDPLQTESAGKDAERIIAHLLKNPGMMAEIRRNGMRYNRGWKEVAEDFVNLFRSGWIAGTDVSGDRKAQRA